MTEEETAKAAHHTPVCLVSVDEGPQKASRCYGAENLEISWGAPPSEDALLGAEMEVLFGRLSLVVGRENPPVDWKGEEAQTSGFLRCPARATGVGMEMVFTKGANKVPGAIAQRSFAPFGAGMPGIPEEDRYMFEEIAQTIPLMARESWDFQKEAGRLNHKACKVLVEFFEALAKGRPYPEAVKDVLTPGFKGLDLVCRAESCWQTLPYVVLSDPSGGQCTG